jgi:hypothetical protein
MRCYVGLELVGPRRLVMLLLLLLLADLVPFVMRVLLSTINIVLLFIMLVCVLF